MKKTLILAILFAGVLFAAPVSAASSYQTGTIIKSPERPEVYFVASDNRRYLFPNMETLKTWYPEHAQIVTTDKRSDMNRIRDSRVFVTVRPGRTLVKFSDSPKIFAVENGSVLRWLKTEKDAVRTYGLKWTDRMVQLPASNRPLYAVGSDIDANATFARLFVTQKATDVDQELKDRRVLSLNKTGSMSVASVKNGGNPAALVSLHENLKANVSPRFNPTIASYLLDALYSEDRLVLTPKATHPGATIRVKDITIASSDSITIQLNFGDNTIPIIVQTPEGVSFSYSLIVRRVEANSDTYLANIRENLRANFENSFDPFEAKHQLDAAYDEEFVRLIPETNDRRSTILVSGVTVKNRGSLTVPLVHGSNVIPIVIRAENGASRTYTLTVHRSNFPKTEDRDLIAIGENLRANLSRNFDPNYTRYWIRADSDEHRVTITAVPRVKNARVSINGDPVASKSIILHDEETKVVIRVEVTDDFFNEYTVVIDKAE